MATLYVFPDTNLFIQCRPLNELDWSLWPDSSEIHLVVTRPVQREIDGQKNRGNDRVGRRARKTHSLFREVITTESGYKVVRETAPIVRLHLDEPRKPSEELSDVLDYGAADDQLLGYMHAYKKQHPEHQVSLLTHDSGPMMTAKNLDLPFTPIPDTWLRDPEESDMEKENHRLRDEMRRLQSGPQFEVAFLNPGGDDVREIDGRQRVYAPLSSAELEALMAALQNRLLRSHSFDLLTTDVYREWLGKCEEILANLHKEIQLQERGISFIIGVQNLGTSPGKDTLIRIATEGKLGVLPFRNEEDLHSKTSEWRKTFPPMPSPQSALLRGLTGPLSLPSAPHIPDSRDPHDFYYTPGFPEYPQQAYALECMQWRHHAEKEFFEGEIFVDHGTDESGGALECTIHADNLPNPIRATVPVRIAVEDVSVWDSASALVEGVGKNG